MSANDIARALAAMPEGRNPDATIAQLADGGRVYFTHVGGSGETNGIEDAIRVLLARSGYVPDATVVVVAVHLVPKDPYAAALLDRSAEVEGRWRP